MARTIAIAVGQDRSGRVKTTHRLGSECASAEANTWRTFARVMTFADGSGMVRVERDGEILHSFVWGDENTNG